MSLIRCEKVSLSYENRIVVSDLSFEVNAGEYWCVVGENGSGKSTLIKAILSLKGVASGRIGFGDGLKRTEIGYLPQSSSIPADFPASVREVVLSGCLTRHRFTVRYTRADRTLAEGWMERLGVTGLSDRPLRDLSGGQRQRVLLARALCATGKMLLLDEPVAGLDPIVTAEMYELIHGLNREGITVIMVSHDLDAAQRYATHILHLQGKPVYCGTADRYRESVAGQHFSGGDGHV